MPERTTLKKDMTDPMLRRISTIYIHIQSIYSRKCRVLVSKSFGLANEVGLAVASAVRVPVERATGLNARAHNSEKRYDRPHVATHFYHLYTYTIDIQPEMKRASAICSLDVWISQTHGDHYLPRRQWPVTWVCDIQPPNEQIADAYCV